MNFRVRMFVQSAVKLIAEGNEGNAGFEIDQFRCIKIITRGCKARGNKTKEMSYS